MIFQGNVLIFSAGSVDQNIIQVNSAIHYFGAIEVIISSDTQERIVAISRGPNRLFCSTSNGDKEIAKAMLLELSSVTQSEPGNNDKLYFVYNFYKSPLERIICPDLGPIDTITLDSIRDNESSSLLGSVIGSKDDPEENLCNHQKNCDRVIYAFLAAGMSIVFSLCIAAIIVAFWK